MTAAFPRSPAWSTRYLLFIAGMGGLLYGIDVGIIAGALPYLESTAALAWKLNAQQLSFVVAAVLLGSVLSSLFAGLLADIIGRRLAMVLSGALFVASIPLIALADGYIPLLAGRLLQGVSGGLIGVIVPLYLAECLDARRRGRGAALFQLLLTVGLVAAALIGLVQASSVQAATDAAAALPEAARAAAVLAAKDHAWRGIFWMCLTPGVVFTLGALLLAESPRWLAQRGRLDAARAVLLRTRGAADAARELDEIARPQAVATRAQDPLLSRRYVLPFLLACLILACNQATGINSVLAYVVNILNRAGLSGASANLADVLLKVLNALMTIVAVLLVDRKGRRFLLMEGRPASSSRCSRSACCSAPTRRSSATCSLR
jgi:MFS family permease